MDAYLTAVERVEWDPTVEAALLREDFLRKSYPYVAQRLLGLAARPDSVPLWRQVARLCETQGDYEHAARLLAEALRANPNDVAALSMQARIAERQQHLAQAAQWHRRILELRPDLRASLVFLAQHQYAQGEYREALPYFARLLVQPRGERSDELYWLLCAVKSSGVPGLEERIGQVLEWPELTAEERSLAHELLTAAGQDRLSREDLEHAEQYLERAYQLEPSPEVGCLLAQAVSKKGERAQAEGHLLHACVYYQRAAEYDPGNPTYTKQVAQAVALRSAERQRRHWRKYQRLGLGAALVLLLGGVFLGVRHAQQRQRAQLAEDDGPTTATQGRALAVQEKAAAAPVRERPERPESPMLSGGSGTRGERVQEAGEGQRETEKETVSPTMSNPSRVETAEALGLQVAGPGRGDPTRSLAALQTAVEAHRADLQAVYERERATNPALLGSVVLHLTIEPNGRVSRARVQSAKVPNPRLAERVLALARTWQFAPAVGRVAVSYPLLFLPPGVDTASVIAWESGTAAGRSKVAIPAPALPAGTERSPAQIPIEQEEVGQRVRDGNAPVLGNDTGNAQAAAEPGREEAHKAPPGSGQRFVHPQSGYSIVPPPGFALVQTGQRTIWQGPEGTQLLVETTSSLGRSARAGWEESHAALAKKYGPRYRSYGITETQLAGRPAAAWEFLLTTAVGKRHKLDVAVLDRGVGYGILVSAPAERFASWRPQFEAALRSFRPPA